MNKEELHKLLNLEVNSESPNFIIYSETLSARLQYVCKFIFEQVLKVKVINTNNRAEFENSTFFKINYSTLSIAGAFQITPNTFLFETGVSENKPKFSLKNNLIYFFETTVNSDFKYDVFSSVFYFISRYEEWQSFEADIHGRFEAKASILFQNKMHLKPVVDCWITELKNELTIYFKEIKFPENKFKIISTIDIDNLYAYKAKGFLRTTGAICKDVFKLDFKNIRSRISVLSKKTQDPFDIYTSVSEFCLNNNIPIIYFFLFRSGTKYDRTVDPNSNAFIEVFKRIKKQSAFIGIHPSYFTLQNKECFQEEVKDLSQRSGGQVNLSRQHYLRFDIKTTPNILLENNIIADFTMGFASEIGFRAGTSYPFYYYNFKSETQKDLLFVPFCVMDGAYFVYDKISPEKMLNSLMEIAGEIKKVNGLFISVFHERTFSDHLYPGYNRIYKNFHQKIKEL